MKCKRYCNFAIIFSFVLFAVPPLFAEDNYVLDIRQSVDLPGGKAAGDDSTATVPYAKTTNGEVDLAYAITVPKTKKLKYYRLCILLPANVKPIVSSMDVQGTVKEYFDLDRDYDTYFSYLENNSSTSTLSNLDNLSRCFVLREIYKKYDIDKSTIKDYYVCLIDLNSSKNLNTSKIEFTITIPENYKNGILYSKISNYAFTEGIGAKEVNLPPKLFSLKIR